MNAKIEQLSLEQLELLKFRVVWGYDAPLGEARQWSYSHSPIAAWLIREGSILLRFTSGVERYGPGQWIFPRKGEGLLSITENTHLLSLRFHADWPDGSTLFPRRHSVTIPTETAHGKALTATAEKLNRYLDTHSTREGSTRNLGQMSLEGYLMLQPLFSAWLVAYFQALVETGCQPRFLNLSHEATRSALHFLQTWPLNKNLTIPILAKQVGLSVSQLNKTFSKDVGLTPASFWNRRKYNVAQIELTNSATSIKVIAHDLGFSSPENFSHWFRSGSGISPRSFRKRGNSAI